MVIPARLWGLSICLASGAAWAAAPEALPPIGGPGTAEHHPGKIIWADLVTPDLDAAERFYGGLFGWTFKSIRSAGTEYAVALRDGHAIGGLLQKPIPAGEHRQPAWLTFIAVRNLDSADRAAVTHGAKALSLPRSYAGRGRQAVFSDPDGAVFGMLASSSGDPPDYLAATGEWIWSSLLTDDPRRDTNFYKAVFGYQSFDLAEEDGAAAADGHAHLILASDDYARASVNPLPAAGHRHAHWLDFVRVDDATAAAKKAVALGGRVLVEPHPDRHGGNIAVVADPAGAPIGLMEWPENDPAGEAK